MSASFGLSPAHLGRLFKACIGCSFHKFVRAERMRKAALALMDLKLGVKQVSAAVGYRDPANFCHEFKAYFGLSPRHFRSQTLSRKMQFLQQKANFHN